MNESSGERTLVELDHLRLTHLVQRLRASRDAPPSLPFIEQLLEGADVLPWQQMPPDTVTMQSRLRLKNLPGGDRNELTLCFPAAADASAGQVSVLSPLGSSLLGQRVGATVRWVTPAGGTLAAEITDVLFQPESSGEFAL
ncbi:MAG: GreA/GreB family elongation factor [Rubrivivax sp.]